jgi:hypothetical protein
MSMTNEQLDTLIDESRPPCPWRVSRKDNRFRRWGNLTLTVFERPAGSGWWTWCVAGPGDAVRFSTRSYYTEADALDALPREVGALG